jgi:hypothetical protein
MSDGCLKCGLEITDESALSDSAEYCVDDDIGGRSSVPTPSW